MKFGVQFLMVVLFSVVAQAAVLEVKPGSVVREGVQISSGAVADVKGEKIELVTVAEGLRAKKVLVANVKVYVAELLVDAPARFVKTDAASGLNSLDDVGVVAMRLNFLRNVEAEKVRVSFEEALTANSVSLKEPALAALLTAVVNGGAADQGGALLFLVKKNSDGSETLVFESTSGQSSVIEGSRGLTKQIFSMWLGLPSDDGIKKLQQQLLK